MNKVMCGKTASAHAHARKSHTEPCDPYTNMHMAVHMWASDERAESPWNPELALQAQGPLPAPPLQLFARVLFAGVSIPLSVGTHCPSCTQSPLQHICKVPLQGDRACLSKQLFLLAWPHSCLETGTHGSKLRVGSAYKTDSSNGAKVSAQLCKCAWSEVLELGPGHWCSSKRVQERQMAVAAGK